MIAATPNLDEIRSLAGSVCDPELPPLTLADLGILRSVERAGDGTIVVTLTPTYSGCPAVEFIENEVRQAIENAGCPDVRVERTFSPTWSTDWIAKEGHEKLRSIGIAPPRPLSAVTPVMLGRGPKPTPPCPHCASTDTTEITPFSSTACKALHRCNECSEPFDHFKEI